MVGSKKIGTHDTYKSPSPSYPPPPLSIISREVILLLDLGMFVAQTKQSGQPLKVYHGLFPLIVPTENTENREKCFYHYLASTH